VALTGGLSASVAAGATTTPTAELSINPSKGALTVELAARSAGFDGSVVSYHWVFGDGRSITTEGRTETHTYPKPGVYKVSVTETGSQKQTATAAGVLDLTVCGTQPSCTESLGNAGEVHLLKVSGPAGAAAPATADLFVGPFQIPDCQLEVVPTAAFADTGFVGNLTVTLEYTTAHANQTPITCFASTVAFKDAGGKSVLNGPLPACGSKPVPPCVKSIATSVSKSGTSVTKVLLVPPGDPKVGAP
jgi:PKD repeat protein